MSRFFLDFWDPLRYFLCQSKQWPHAECGPPPLRKADAGKYPQGWIFSLVWMRVFDSVSDLRRVEVFGGAGIQFLEKGSGACEPAYQREANLEKDCYKSGGKVWITGWIGQNSGKVKRGQRAREASRLPKLPPPRKLWNRWF